MSQRSRIAMTDDEVTAFGGEHSRFRLATITPRPATVFSGRVES